MAVMMNRIGLVLAVGLLVFAAGVGVSWVQQDVNAAPRETFTVEVSEAGFNPGTCRVSRGVTMFWKNVGSTPRRVIWADPHGGAPLFDSGEIAPGAVSARGFSGFEFPSRWVFTDAFDPSLRGFVITPTFSNGQPADCTPSPRTVPPPGQSPTDCSIAIACVHAGGLAADG